MLTFTLPITVLWLLVEAWRHVRATRLLAAATPPALPPASLPPYAAPAA